MGSASPVLSFCAPPTDSTLSVQHGPRTQGSLWNFTWFFFCRAVGVLVFDFTPHPKKIMFKIIQVLILNPFDIKCTVYLSNNSGQVVVYRNGGCGHSQCVGPTSTLSHATLVNCERSAS